MLCFDRFTASSKVGNNLVIGFIDENHENFSNGKSEPDLDIVRIICY